MRDSILVPDCFCSNVEYSILSKIHKSNYAFSQHVPSTPKEQEAQRNSFDPKNIRQLEKVIIFCYTYTFRNWRGDPTNLLDV